MDRPHNIGEHVEQLRAPIVRSKGLTDSERYLATLCDRTFLNLWSYPNPYRSQKIGGAGDGKEICDLIVVCDPHVLIFSEKKISWTNKPLDVAWPRWCRRAVFDAAAQLRGAERWINEFPDRIFLDKLCEIPFPIVLPPSDRRRVHRIIVSRGAEEAGRKYFDGGLGTFVIRPELKGHDHCDPKAGAHMPFAIGDIDPEGDYVHVFDDVSLEIVLSELDTITDFTEYLDKRAEFIRSGKLGLAHGEEDLLAYYAIRINEHGQHDFTPPNGRTWEEVSPMAIGSGHWTQFISNPQYFAKKEADEISYAWDRLIETFTDHMLGGTSIVLPGQTYSLKNSEIAVRHMALQNRFLRRAHSEAILGALEIGRGKEVFFRAMLSPEGPVRSETGFFFLTLKYLRWMDDLGGYEKYRHLRSFYLLTYAQALLMLHPHLQQIIGIGMEPPENGRGSSEDIVFGAQTDWSEADRQQNRNDCAALGIMNAMTPTFYRGQEFPEVQRRAETRPSENRKQRRTKAAKSKRRQ